jgi:hypothetical protein
MVLLMKATAASTLALESGSKRVGRFRRVEGWKVEDYNPNLLTC